MKNENPALENAEQFFDEITKEIVIHDAHTKIVPQVNKSLEFDFPDPATNPKMEIKKDSVLHTEAEPSTLDRPPILPTLPTSSPQEVKIPRLDESLFQEKTFSKIKQVTKTYQLEEITKVSRNSDLLGSLPWGKFLMVTLGIIVIFYAGKTLFKANRNVASISSDPWEMQLDRPFIEIFPHYTDWSEVEKDLSEAAGLEK